MSGQTLPATTADPKSEATSAPKQQWWDAAAIATYLGIERTTVYAYRCRSDGGFPAPDLVNGKRLLWRSTTIENWQASRPRPGGQRRGRRAPSPDAGPPAERYSPSLPVDPEN